MEYAANNTGPTRKACNYTLTLWDKLTRVRPETLGQAARIPGVTPAAIAILDVYLSVARVC